MRALTWQGRRNVSVETVPDPRIEEPTDAIVRITSTAICGSDLHLYEIFGPFIDPGDVLGHEPMGIVEEVGAAVTNLSPGQRVVIPFNISCGECFMCRRGLQSQCETTQVTEYGTGASLFGYTKLYGQVPGGQAELLRVRAHDERPNLVRRGEVLSASPVLVLREGYRPRGEEDLDGFERPPPRRGEERVVIRCRHVYFGTAVRRDVTVVFAPSCVTMEWRSDTSGLYIETRLAPSHMTSFDLYHGPARGAGGDGEANPINLADDDEMAPDAIREFFAIGLRQKPPHLRSVEGFEPSDDAGPRKYVVVVLDGEALATFKREAVPAVVWGGHLGWPAAPVLGTAVAARPFLEGVPIADALAAADAARRRPLHC